MIVNRHQNLWMGWETIFIHSIHIVLIWLVALRLKWKPSCQMPCVLDHDKKKVFDYASICFLVFLNVHKLERQGADMI